MNSMHTDVAVALVDARLASARQRQLASQAKNGRRQARRAERTVVPGGWRRRWLSRWPIGATSPTAQAAEPRWRRLDSILDRTAERIVESGTRTEATTLCAMSAATRRLCPGAAEALVDWDGSEPARQRAFGIVHGVVLRDLGTRGRSRLLDQLTGTAPGEVSALTALLPVCVTSAAGHPATHQAAGGAGESRGEAA